MATKLTDLPVDMLTIIMTNLGKEYNGRAEVAKSMSLCKKLLNASNNNDVLTTIEFQHLKVERRHFLFQQTKGILYKCAQAGNISAQYVLAKVFLLTTTQLLSLGVEKENLKDLSDNSKKRKRGPEKCRGKAKAAIFVTHLSPKPKPESEALAHWKLAKSFITYLRVEDILSMSEHLQNYVEYFMGSNIYEPDVYLFMRSYNTMCRIARNSWPSGACLIRNQGRYYVKYPPITGFDVNEQLIDWRKVDVFELFKGEALFAFDRLIEQLH